jgi:hypothetical protein|tara:strand:+ start:922 stop:1131 length:210 start_codon:yes stop_codon:yes gene_type:complete
MVSNIQQQKSSRQKSHENENPNTTNLDKYKQKMKQKGNNTSTVLKTSVQETMSRLQDQSRLNGGTYNTN